MQCAIFVFKNKVFIEEYSFVGSKEEMIDDMKETVTKWTAEKYDEYDDLNQKIRLHRTFDHGQSQNIHVLAQLTWLKEGNVDFDRYEFVVVKLSEEDGDAV